VIAGAEWLRYGAQPMAACEHHSDNPREYGYSDFAERVGELGGGHRGKDVVDT